MSRPDDARLSEALSDYGSDLLRYLQRRAPEDAADLLGSTMLVAWRKRADMPAETTQLRPWLYGIARMTLRGHHRDEARRLRLTKRVRILAPVQENVDQALEVDVRSAISKLPDGQRELVELVHWEGMAIGDAAMVIGVNASTARNRYAKAKVTLAHTLASSIMDRT